MSDSHLHRGRSGFTLFELLVVMALIGIMAAFVLPRVGGNEDRLRLKTAVKDVASIMRYARNQAVTRGRDFSVYYASKANQIIVMPNEPVTEESNDVSSDETNGPMRQYRLPAGVLLDFSTRDDGGNDNLVLLAVFYSMGNSSGGGVILTDNRNIKKEIQVDLISGTVKVVK